MKVTSIIISLLVAILLFAFIRERILVDKLSKNHAITCGYIYRVSPSGWKSSYPTFYYFYLVNNEKKYGHADITINDKDSIFFMRRCFPLIYIPDNPDIDMMLIDNYDFERVGIPRPDSLRWVDDYLRK